MTTIRRAIRRDIPGCLEASASRKDTFFTRKDFENALLDDDTVYLVADANGKVAGFVLGYVNPTKNDEAMIQSTMVNAEYDNKGLALCSSRPLQTMPSAAASNASSQRWRTAPTGSTRSAGSRKPKIGIQCC